MPGHTRFDPVDETEWDDLTPPEDDDGTELWLVNTQTGEHFRTTMEQAMTAPKREEFNRFCRDARAPGQPHRVMDPSLMTLCWRLQQMLNTRPFNLTSLYRTAARNATLPGAATNSLHVRGQAFDVAKGSMGNRLAQAALQLRMGGVGRYTTFTHIDTGPVRTWGSG